MNILSLLHQLKKFESKVDPNAEIKFWNRETDEYYDLKQITTEARVLTKGQKINTLHLHIVPEDH
jgi:hypothetical protein